MILRPSARVSFYSEEDVARMHAFGEGEQIRDMVRIILDEWRECKGRNWCAEYRRWVLAAGLRGVVVELSGFSPEKRRLVAGGERDIPWEDVDALAKRVAMAPYGVRLPKAWQRELVRMGRRLIANRHTGYDGV